ncbi:MAG: hypothetical protein IT380_26280 [Myxococcales bacterium]|nr:hypothetical protein [Myxococcales bacterium]
MELCQLGRPDVQRQLRLCAGRRQQARIWRQIRLESFRDVSAGVLTMLVRPKSFDPRRGCEALDSLEENETKVRKAAADDVRLSPARGDMTTSDLAKTPARRSNPSSTGGSWRSARTAGRQLHLPGGDDDTSPS